MKTNKRELTVFAVCAYAVPFLMMPLLYICLQNGQDTSIFANAQMFYPAAGVMLAFLLAKRQETPKRFYSLHIVSAVLMLVMSVLSVAMPQTGWLTIANVVIIIASVLGWILLLTEKKERREAYGLRLHGKFLTALAICVYFLAVKTGMVFLSVAMLGGDTWANYLAYWRSPTPWIMAMALIPNFFLSFLPFFGEEYGWRYYLTPALQGRFGARRGALAVGVLWLPCPVRMSRSCSSRPATWTFPCSSANRTRTPPSTHCTRRLRCNLIAEAATPPGFSFGNARRGLFCFGDAKLTMHFCYRISVELYRLFPTTVTLCRQKRQEHGRIHHGADAHVRPTDDLVGDIRRACPDENHIIVQIMQQYGHPNVFAAFFVGECEKHAKRHTDNKLRRDTLQGCFRAVKEQVQRQMPQAPGRGRPRRSL